MLVEKLKEVYAVLDRGWTRGAYARDKKGRVIDPKDDRVVECCLSGAVRRVCTSTTEIEMLSSALNEEIGKIASGYGIVWWNDCHDRTKEEVLQLVQSAIDACQSSEKKITDV